MRHIYMNPLNDEGDAVLVAQVLTGNRDAFGTLAARYYTNVLGLCVRLLSDPVEAQDVAQEAVLQAFLGLNRLQQPERFGAWLYAIAANLARSVLRRPKSISFDGLETTEWLEIRPTTYFSSFEQVIAMREIHDTIVAALSELSIVNREAVIGYYLQGYSYAELASLLGLPVSTVKSRLFKGRQQLRQSLEHLGHPEPLPLVPARKESTMSQLEYIELQVEMICEYTLTQRSIVVLGGLSGQQYLAVRMLTEEAIIVERALKCQPDNPLVTSQDALLQLLVKLGGRIEQVILRSLGKQNYYAILIVAQNGDQHEVDCRLSDAIALAIRAQVPIQVASELMREAGFMLEHQDTDPAIAEAELANTSETVATSDQWAHSSVESVWSFLLDVAYGRRKPYDLSKLWGRDWGELFPNEETNWDGQTLQVVRLPFAEPAWLLVNPELWRQISRFVEWTQHREISISAEAQPPFVNLSAEQQSRLQELFEKTWPTLVDLGARNIALLHLSGRIIFWKNLDNYETAFRMGRAAVKDLLLTRQLTALVDAVAEPGIKLTYERSTAFNPAQAAGGSVSWTTEVLIHRVWLLVTGLETDHQHQEMHRQLERLQRSLAALLPT